MPEIKIYTTYDYGDIVFDRTDTSQNPLMVAQICILPGKQVKYGVNGGMGFQWYYEFELSQERNISLSL